MNVMKSEEEIATFDNPTYATVNKPKKNGGLPSATPTDIVIEGDTDSLDV